MQFAKHTFIFLQTNILQLWRKWRTLPLLLLFPIIIIGLIGLIVVSIVSPSEDKSISVGLVDLDQSDETTMIIELMEESNQLGTFIQMDEMKESEAISAMQQNEISTYLVFPNEFTKKLYTGKSVEISIIGNPEQSLESQLIKEIVDSVTRHISTSQANILAINYYAKELGMNEEDRSNLLFEQFQEFLFYTLGKDRILNEEEIRNNATSSPILYYSISAWFIILTIWLLVIYNFLYQEDSIKMQQRMKMYGVTELSKQISKGIVTLVFVSILAGAAFLTLHLLQEEIQLPLESFSRIAILTLLYSIIYLELLVLLETLIRNSKLRLLIQSMITLLIILLSGAVIPTIYYPLYIQSKIEHIFSTQTFYWLQEIIVNGRLYADYLPLFLTIIIGFLIMIGCSLWKERINQ
ncbi:ABC-2 type transport system permease protein [Oceanobacillus limi]|uniref:ABC-2 type transport system permease protein n=1 Tax=Oceanobacillus limi TaxID=930131 RepID=A0A1I0EF40_9BACI|nr:ABC transporter permease [Oceanobacillus limi]SET44010.1 ABC-2 type transport system permease protein [Oceanobacillus limi]